MKLARDPLFFLQIFEFSLPTLFHLIKIVFIEIDDNLNNR